MRHYGIRVTYGANIDARRESARLKIGPEQFTGDEVIPIGMSYVEVDNPRNSNP